MTFDPNPTGERVLIVLALFGVCWTLDRLGRALFFWAAITLFCIGEWGGALLSLWLWSGAESAHRRYWAAQRAAGLYDGRWID